MSARPCAAEHYTSLAHDEGNHSHADCGCTLRRDDAGNVRLFQCSTHDAAPDLLKALEGIIPCLEGWLEIQDPEDARAYDQEALAAARAAIARAKGQP